MSKKDIFSIVGFLLFILGFMSLILGMVGIKIIFMQWMDAFGGVTSLVLKVVMIVTGIVMVVVTRGDEARFDDYLERERN